VGGTELGQARVFKAIFEKDLDSHADVDGFYRTGQDIGVDAAMGIIIKHDPSNDVRRLVSRDQAHLGDAKAIHVPSTPELNPFK